jgi:hypothetical protein
MKKNITNILSYLKKVIFQHMLLTKFLTGGRRTTRSTSLVGRANPVAMEPNIFVLDLGQRTCRARKTFPTAALMNGFLIKFSVATWRGANNNHKSLK